VISPFAPTLWQAEGRAACKRYPCG
jgi:hypothetical protein